MTYSLRGFTLLIALILTSVILAVGVALLDIAVKQLQLSSSAKNSQYAFYNADSALECALYWDQKGTGNGRSAFDYNSPVSPLTSLMCDTRNVINTTQVNNSGTLKIEFELPCAGGGTSAKVTVYKKSDGTTDIYANGYNTCTASNPLRIERGLKVHY